MTAKGTVGAPTCLSKWTFFAMHLRRVEINDFLSQLTQDLQKNYFFLRHLSVMPKNNYFDYKNERLPQIDFFK
jgi:hypothetical protein